MIGKGTGDGEVQKDHHVNVVKRSAIEVNPSAALFVRKKDAANQAEIIHRPSVSYWKDAWLRIRKNRLAVASGVYIVLLAFAALVMPSMIEYTHDEQEVWNLHLPPSLGETALVVSPEMTIYEPKRLAESENIEPGFAVEPPPAPTGVSIMGDALTTGVAVQWDPVEGAEGYLVYRSIDSEIQGLPLGEVSASELSFFDNATLQAGDEYFYRVYAINAFGESESSEVIKAVPRLALPVSVAKAFDAEAKPGQVVLTHPHYLGTDYLGRDMLARILMGARISLFIGFGAPLIYIFIGVIYGCISGYFGGLIDDVMMRFADIVATVPELLTVIMLQVFLGSGVHTLILALVVVAWARSARQLRGEVLRLRESEFVYAGRVLGTPTWKIIVRHLLPNTTGTILVLFTLAIPQAIFTEAFLSFIGLGIKPPLASWGSVVREGAKVFLAYPHELIIPAFFICISIFAFNMLGDGLRDALDPKLRGAK